MLATDLEGTVEDINAAQTVAIGRNKGTAEHQRSGKQQARRQESTLSKRHRGLPFQPSTQRLKNGSVLSGFEGC